MADLLDAVEREEMTVEALARASGASTATIRRDLAHLARRGMIVRTRGGARAATAERPEGLRDVRYPDAKRRIAAAVARMLPAGTLTVAVGGGTTTAEVARELAARSDLTMITNSLTIAHVAAREPGCRVLMTGGRLRLPSLELVGPLAERSFASVSVAFAMLGADGVSADGGVATHDEAEARTNHAMIAGARRTVVVADGSKIGRTAPVRIATAGEIDLLVTDRSADPAEVRRLRSAGASVVIV